jgi:flagellar basal-body rod modification protein FlgD
MSNPINGLAGIISEQPKPQQKTPGSDMGKEEFLRLLVTQLSNQDPMNPLDGQEFAAQLAHFTSVEQLLNIQQTLVANGELNSVLAQGINSGVASGLIGRTIEADGAALLWDGSTTGGAGFDLAGAATEVHVTIRDAAGNIVRVLDLGSTEAGKHTIDWNGRDANGATVPKGTYTMEVSARDTNGDRIPTQTFTAGRVERVTFGQDGIKLWIGELGIAMGKVRSVQEGS